jgi:uncharacterized membrane protein
MLTFEASKQRSLNMRKWLMLAFGANILLMLIAWWLLPEKTATHFSLGGSPDAWGSKESYLFLLLAVESPLFLILLFIPATLWKFPERLINLPHKEYWLRPENKPRVQTLFAERTARMGVVFFAFLAVVQLLVMDANLSDPVRLKESLFLPVLIAFLLYMLYWTFTFIRVFRVPEGGTNKPA